MRVENARNKFGASVANHFILRNVTFEGIQGNAFQCGTVITAFKPYDKDISIHIDRIHGDTGESNIRHRTSFLNISPGEFTRKIKANEFVLTDLNEYEWI